MTDFFDIHPRLLEVSRQAEDLCRKRGVQRTEGPFRLSEKRHQ